MDATIERIREQARALGARRKPSKGSLLVGTTEPTLYDSGIAPHELTDLQLGAALVYAGTTLLNAGPTAVVTYDQELAWAWCSEILVNSGPTTVFADYEPYAHMRATYHCALPPKRKPIATSDWVGVVQPPAFLP